MFPLEGKSGRKNTRRVHPKMTRYIVSQVRGQIMFLLKARNRRSGEKRWRLQ